MALLPHQIEHVKRQRGLFDYHLQEIHILDMYRAQILGSKIEVYTPSIGSGVALSQYINQFEGDDRLELMHHAYPEAFRSIKL